MAASPAYHVQSPVDNPSTFLYHTFPLSAMEPEMEDIMLNKHLSLRGRQTRRFEKVFEDMIEAYNDDYDIVCNPDLYAAPFFPVAEELTAHVSSKEQIGRADEAHDLYLRAAALYRIVRFPINRSPRSQKAWELGKAA